MRNVTNTPGVKKLLLIPVLAFAILLTGCGSNNQDSIVDDNSGSLTNLEDKKVEDTSKKEIEESKVAKDEKEKKEDIEAAVSHSIAITSIKAGDTMISPILLVGTADIESGVVIAELRKTDHTITSNKVQAQVRDGKFRISKFWFQFKNTEEGFVAVYDKENPENIVEIPVKFQTVK